MSASKRKNGLLITCVAAAALLAGVVLYRPPQPELLEVPREELSLRDGRLHRNNESAPFSGRMIERHPDGTLKSRSEVAAGLLEGLSEGWYPNGQLQVRENFKEGVSDGARQKWHENGKLMSETTIQQGEHNGVFRRWHENGQLAEELNLVQGKADGISHAYHPSGYLKARVLLAKGEVLKQEFWEDGQKLRADAGGSP